MTKEDISDILEKLNFGGELITEEYICLKEYITSLETQLKGTTHCYDETEHEKLKQIIQNAIDRISLLRMDDSTSLETHKALDYVLKALLGDDKEDV